MLVEAIEELALANVLAIDEINVFDLNFTCERM